MTRNRNTARTNTTTELERYCATLHDRVLVISRRTRSEHDARDIAQNVVEQFLRSPERLMANYPDAALYASVRTGHAGLDFDRGERRQRCEGARLTVNTRGERSRARTWLSGDAPLAGGDGRLFDIVIDGGPDFTETHAEIEGVQSMLTSCLNGLTGAERDLVTCIDGHGHSVTEMAETSGVRRETLSRRLTKIRAHVGANAAEFAVAA